MCASCVELQTRALVSVEAARPSCNVFERKPRWEQGAFKRASCLKLTMQNCFIRESWLCTIWPHLWRHGFFCHRTVVLSVHHQSAMDGRWFTPNNDHLTLWAALLAKDTLTLIARSTLTISQQLFSSVLLRIHTDQAPKGTEEQTKTIKISPQLVLQQNSFLLCLTSVV